MWGVKVRSEEHTSELQSPKDLVCRLLLEKKNIFGFNKLLGQNTKQTMPVQPRALRDAMPSASRIESSFSCWANSVALRSVFFFFNDTATTEIYTLSLHDALPISEDRAGTQRPGGEGRQLVDEGPHRSEEHTSELQSPKDLVCRLLLEKKKNE